MARAKVPAGCNDTRRGVHQFASTSVALLLVLLALTWLASCRPTEAKSIEISAANLAAQNTDAPGGKPQSALKFTSNQIQAGRDKIVNHKQQETTTSASSTEDADLEHPFEEDDTTGTGASDCANIDRSDLLQSEPKEATKLSDNARLVELQSWLQEKVRARLAGAQRDGLEMFERLSLSGGCTSSLMNLMVSLRELKAFAFKFLDASAKIPSGMMYGLLSDFGDYDQCLSIRSRPGVLPAEEVEEGAYSGKYCLLSIRLNYHVQTGPNGSAPAGIEPDSVLWDELVRNYWTTKSAKGFQVGVCVPSRCSHDDLTQIYNLLAEQHNFLGEVTICQDSNDLSRQQTADWLQFFILDIFGSLLALNLLATLLERYSNSLPAKFQSSFTFKLIICFSIRRNWRLFLAAQPSTTIDQARQRSPILRHQVESFHSNLTETTQGSSESHFTAESSADEHEGNGANFERSNECHSEQLGTVIERAKDGDEHAGHFQQSHLLSHLSGLKLLVIVWITVGHSFLYPSANNYQYYRSIINMNITRDSVWFAATNFTLGIDMLLYMSGLLFVRKLTHLSPAKAQQHQLHLQVASSRSIGVALVRKILRFWPTYLAVIGLAIVVPLLADGPMWPEMVERRLGAACRENWWANLLMINNLMSEPRVCLPSSWFVSVTMQCLIVGSLVLLVGQRYSLRSAVALALTLILASSLIAFLFAYQLEVPAPAIRMDASFVLQIDDLIYRLYTSTFSNLGPFLVGMLGGLTLNWWQLARTRQMAPQTDNTSPLERAASLVCALNLALAVGLVGLLVLSSVFHKHYTRLWASVYWSCHRLGWALVTGYLVHQCATSKWRLLRSLLALRSLLPLSKLVFIAYLVYPIFIHLHSGLVRDGLHVSIYNMLNIYITRLVFTFTTALLLHLCVEQPLCSLESLLLATRWSHQAIICNDKRPQTGANNGANDEMANQNRLPLLSAGKPLVGRKMSLKEEHE